MAMQFAAPRVIPHPRRRKAWMVSQRDRAVMTTRDKGDQGQVMSSTPRPRASRRSSATQRRSNSTIQRGMCSTLRTWDQVGLSRSTRRA